MSKKLIFNLIFLFFFFIIAGIIYYLDNRKANIYMAGVIKEYPSLSFLKEYNGLVTDIYMLNRAMFRDNLNSRCITLNDTLRICITTSDEISTGYSLDDIIKIGASVQKRSHNDTLFVYHQLHNDTVRYVFIIEDVSYYEKKFTKFMKE